MLSPYNIGILSFPMSLDSQDLRRQFPFLHQDPTPIYLDSAASAQKPQAVIDAIEHAYISSANVHRGLHAFAEISTTNYEAARDTVRSFTNAAHSDEIIFTRNSTEGINLVARSFGSSLKKGDRIILSLLEHHSNIVPWLQLKEERGIEIEWIDIDGEGHLRMDEYAEAISSGNVKLVSISGQSNVLGIRTPLKEIISMAHKAGARVLVDGAQLIAHTLVDVQDLDCDFFVFSGHKLYGPTGIGVLYGKRELLRSMPPFLGGGMMIREVTTEMFTPADPPQKFEAGTPPVSEAIGLRAAIEWLQTMPIQDREAHEHQLITHAHRELQKIEGLHILGPQNPAERSGVISFTIDGTHAHDLTDILGQKGFALRAGHHCTQPLHDHLGIVASTRLSVALYNTTEEIDALIPEIKNVKRKLL